MNDRIIRLRGKELVDALGLRLNSKKREKIETAVIPFEYNHRFGIQYFDADDGRSQLRDCGFHCYCRDTRVLVINEYFYEEGGEIKRPWQQPGYYQRGRKANHIVRIADSNGIKYEDEDLVRLWETIFQESKHSRSVRDEYRAVAHANGFIIPLVVLS
jgi:hypothetical protein